ncbi:hypothetical protein RCL1_003440 [Eukaryota sp. TZLM3-RCL]
MTDDLFTDIWDDQVSSNCLTTPQPVSSSTDAFLLDSSLFCEKIQTQYPIKNNAKLKVSPVKRQTSASTSRSVLTSRKPASDAQKKFDSPKKPRAPAKRVLSFNSNGSLITKPSDFLPILSAEKLVTNEIAVKKPQFQTVNPSLAVKNNVDNGPTDINEVTKSRENVIAPIKRDVKKTKTISFKPKTLPKMISKNQFKRTINQIDCVRLHESTISADETKRVEDNKIVFIESKEQINHNQSATLSLTNHRPSLVPPHSPHLHCVSFTVKTLTLNYPVSDNSTFNQSLDFICYHLERFYITPPYGFDHVSLMVSPQLTPVSSRDFSIFLSPLLMNYVTTLPGNFTLAQLLFSNNQLFCSSRVYSWKNSLIYFILLALSQISSSLTCSNSRHVMVEDIEDSPSILPYAADNLPILVGKKRRLGPLHNVTKRFAEVCVEKLEPVNSHTCDNLDNEDNQEPPFEQKTPMSNNQRLRRNRFYPLPLKRLNKEVGSDSSISICPTSSISGELSEPLFGSVPVLSPLPFVKRTFVPPLASTTTVQIASEKEPVLVDSPVVTFSQITEPTETLGLEAADGTVIEHSLYPDIQVFSDLKSRELLANRRSQRVLRRGVCDDDCQTPLDVINDWRRTVMETVLSLNKAV